MVIAMNISNQYQRETKIEFYFSSIKKKNSSLFCMKNIMHKVNLISNLHEVLFEYSSFLV